MRVPSSPMMTLGASVLLVGGLVGCAPQPVTAPSSRLATPAATEQVAPGDIPDTQAFVTTTGPSKAWSVKIPEGWSKQTKTSGFVFTDKYNVIAVTERTGQTALSPAAARADEVARLAAAHPGFVLKRVAAVIRAGGSGVVIAYESDSVKNAVTGKVHRDASEAYVFQRQDRRVVLDLSGAAGADNVDPWRIITDSFRWVR